MCFVQQIVTRQEMRILLGAEDDGWEVQKVIDSNQGSMNKIFME